MPEESNSNKRVTKEELIRLISDVVDIEIDGRTFAIRPITFAEDTDIERAVTEEKSEGARMRQRVFLTVWKGLVEPKLEMSDIEMLPAGLVMKIAIEINNLSAGVPKN